MNKVARSFRNKNSYQRIPVVRILYLLIILIAPFAGVYLLLFLSLGLFLTLRFSEIFFPRREVISLSFSLVLMLLISVVSNEFPLYVVLAAFAVVAVGNHKTYFLETDPVSVFNSSRNRIKKRNFSLFWSSIFLALRIITAFLAASWFVYWEKLPVPYNFIFFIAVIGAVTAYLFESIPSNIDANISVPLGAGMTMWIFEEFSYWVPPEYMLLSLILSLFLGALAYTAKIADVSALLSAALLGILILAFSGVDWFMLLFAFFFLGGLFTKYKYEYKKFVGSVQLNEGINDFQNVFSNSTAALVLAVAYGIFPEHSLPIIYAYMGAVATATGNTLASEIGTTSKKRPRMITTLELAEPGDDGAVSLIGELASISGSAIIGLLAYLLGVSDNLLLSVIIAAVGGFVGTNFDSFLGATLQKRGVLSNSGVNFLATFAGAGISEGLYLLITLT